MTTARPATAGGALARARRGRAAARVLHRHPRLRLAALLSLPGAVAGGRLPRLARGPVRRPRSGPRTPSPATWSARVTLDNFQTLLAEPVYRTIALRTRRRRGGGDGRRRADRAADRVLHGQGGVAAGAAGAGRGGPHPAVGELPGQGVRLAGDARARTASVDWALHPLGLHGPGYGLLATVADAGLPVAAVHDPADLRRARAGARLAARGVRATSARRPGGPSGRSCCRCCSRPSSPGRSSRSR